MNPPTPPRLVKAQPCQGIECRTKGMDSTRWAYKLGGQGSYGFDTLFPQDMDINESDMSVFIPIADGNRRDGVGDLLDVTGINCERHRLNSIVLFDHGKQVTLPIALAETRDTKLYTFTIDPVSRTAGLRAYFYQGRGGDTLTTTEYGKQYDHALYCEQLFDMVAKKMLRAGSIGYQVIEADQMPADYATGTPQGLHLKRILMLEGSLVVLPANMDTVGKMLCDGVCCGKNLSPYLVKSLTPYKIERNVQMSVPAQGKAIETINQSFSTRDAAERWGRAEADKLTRRGYPTTFVGVVEENVTTETYEHTPNTSLKEDRRVAVTNRVYKPQIETKAMSVPGHDHKDCHCGGTCGKCSKEGKSMEVQTKADPDFPSGLLSPEQLKRAYDEGAQAKRDGKGTNANKYANGSPRHDEWVRGYEGKSLPSRTQLTTNQLATPYTPPPLDGPADKERVYAADTMTSNPANLLVSDGSKPGDTTSSNFSWAKVKQLRKNIRMKRGNKTITGIKRMSSSESADCQYGVKWTVRGGGNGSKWFTTEQEREQFMDKLADKYGGYDVIDASYSDPHKGLKAMSALRAGAGAELVGAKSSKEKCPDCGYPKNECICMTVDNTSKPAKKGLNGKKSWFGSVDDAIEEAKRDAKRSTYTHYVVDDGDGFDIVTTQNPSRGKVVAKITANGLVEKYSKSLNGHKKNGLSPLTPVPKVHAAQRQYQDRVLAAAADDDVNAGNLKNLRMKYRKKGLKQAADVQVGDEIEGKGRVVSIDNSHPNVYIDFTLDTGKNVRATPYGYVSVKSLPKARRKTNDRCVITSGEHKGETGVLVSFESSHGTATVKLDSGEELSLPLVWVKLQSGKNLCSSCGKSLPGHETKGWGNWLHAIAAVLATLIGEPGLANINLELMGDDLGLDDLYGEGKTPQQAAEVIKPKVRRKMLEAKTKAQPKVYKDEKDGKWYVMLPGEPRFGPYDSAAEAEEDLRGAYPAKSIDAIRFDWGDQQRIAAPGAEYDTSRDDSRIFHVRENGSERTVTFAELANMVGRGEAERLRQMAIRKGTGHWHATSDSYSPGGRGYAEKGMMSNPLSVSFAAVCERWDDGDRSTRANMLYGAGIAAPLADKLWREIPKLEQVQLLRTYGKALDVKQKKLAQDIKDGEEFWSKNGEYAWASGDAKVEGDTVRIKDGGTGKVHIFKLGQNVKTAGKSLDKYPGKSLPDIRMKYRAVKRYRRTLRRSKPGSSSFNIHEKDLNDVRTEAKAAGCKASWSGGDGNSIRVKLTGSDEAIDGICRKWARKGR